MCSFDSKLCYLVFGNKNDDDDDDLTSPQSNLRRVFRSSTDKMSTRIANYWDCTALACCRHSKRVEPSRNLRLYSDRRMRSACVVCCAAAKMTTGHSSAASAQSPCCVCFVTFFAHEFLFNLHFDLEPDNIIRKPIIHRILRLYST